MSWKSHLRATAGQIRKVVKEFDEALSSDPDYVRAKQVAAEARDSVKSKSLELIEQAAGTEFGENLGKGSRRVAGVISKAPVLSATGDALGARVGMPDLLNLRSSRPGDPWPMVWIAEALVQLRKDRNIVLTVRAPLEPISAAAAMSLRTSAAVGADDPVEKTLRAAWSLAVQGLADDPTALGNAHVLARVYLARDMPEPASRMAAIGALDPEDGSLSLVTLARALNAQGRYPLAHQAAQQAVDLGCTLGYQLLAKSALESGDRQSYVEMYDRVTKDDRRRYSGVATDVGNVLTATLAAQSAKVSDVVRSVRHRLESL